MHLETPIVFQIGNRQSALGNVKMVRRPRLLPFLKGSNFGSVGDVPLRPPERNSRPIKGITPLGTLKRLLLATFSNRSYRPLTGFVSFQTVRHFDPFGTELL